MRATSRHLRNFEGYTSNKLSPGNQREENRLEADRCGNPVFRDDAPRPLRIPAFPQRSTSAGLATRLRRIVWREVTLLFTTGETCGAMHLSG
ncbi:MAG: hypothetical protein LAP86_08500 [Acidobacteriia bacterium]|nr:hypothetical protein [Terriglobia bacterium]